MLTTTQDPDTIYSRAVQIASATQREAYLAEACGNDAALRRQVEERLAAHDSHSSPANGAAATASHPARHQEVPAGTNEATDVAPARGTLHQVWSVLRARPRVLTGVVLSQLLLLTGAIAGTGLGVWAWRAEEQARGEAHEAITDRDQAQKTAKQAKEQIEQAEAALKAADKERDQAIESEKTTQHEMGEIRAVLAFFNNNVVSAGRPVGWAGGQGKDVTLRKALDVAESKVADAFKEHPLAEAAIREMLGAAYLDVEEAPLAVKQYEQALALREAVQGEDNPDTFACRNRLAVAYRQAGRFDDASRLYDQNVNSSAHAAGLAIRGSLLLSLKKPTEAETKLREALSIRQKLQPDAWTTFDTRSMLGEALLQQKKFAEAEPLLVSGYEGLKQREAKIPPWDKLRLSKALDRLVQLYTAWDKKAEAQQWRKELETAKAATKQ
jgi:tetratricopeptide (TPR) repeat protein